MNDVVCNPETEQPSAWNDNRFNIIQDKARELKGLTRELNEMSCRKFNELLGNYPVGDPEEISQEPVCWADRVIMEQDIAIGTIREALDRIASV